MKIYGHLENGDFNGEYDLDEVIGELSFEMDKGGNKYAFFTYRKITSKEYREIAKVFDKVLKIENTYNM